MAAKDKTRPSSITYDYLSPDHVRDQGVQLQLERQMKEEANVQARSILWAAFAVLLPFEPALAQAINPTVVQKVALAAVRTNVWGIVDLNPDCSLAGPTTVKIRKEPRHGKIEIEDENGFPGYPSNNPRFHCNKIQVPMTKIYYTGEDNYGGKDTIELEVFSSRGSSWKMLVNVTVKK